MRIQWLTALPLAAAGALACSDSTAPTAGAPVSLSFSTTGAGGASLSRTPDPSFASTADALVITKAQLVIARVELVRAGATCTSEVPSGDDDVGDDDCAELQLAPSLVDLPVNGTVVNALEVTIPEGSYSSLEAKLRPISAGSSGSGNGRGSAAFLAAHPDLNGVSVLVEGTFNGTAFTYRGAVSSSIERSFSPPLTVTGAPLGLTVNADLATWFRNASGALIDPRTANAGGANAQLVADNIKRSFHAFRDDDHNGRDDDGAGHT